jgi:putative ABC transport system permease protein
MNRQYPPGWSDRFLEWYCSNYYLEEVQGDLYEWYINKVAKVGRRRANFYYGIAVIRYLHFSRIKPIQKLITHPKYLSMKSILKITYRNLIRDKLSGFIRLGNLVIGISIFLLALVYARYELNYDQFHENGDNIYRLGMAFESEPWAATPMGLGAVAYNDVPEVKRMTRFIPIRDAWIKYGEKRFYEKAGFYADSSTFQMFTYPMIKGNPKTALVNPTSIVLTESLAKKYFGDADPMGKYLELSADADREGNIEPRLVTGIIKDLPEQAHLQFDYLCSAYSFDADFLEKWQNFWVYTYVELESGSSTENTSSIIANHFIELRDIEEKLIPLVDVRATPISKIHLYSNHEKEYADNGNIFYIYILFSIGAFVLIISCINFINLTIIKGLDRAKEVGLRKTVGATRHQLVIQFLSENMVLLISAGIICLSVLALLAPVFQRFSALELPLNVFTEPSILIPLLLILLVLQVISGLYPALLLSKFRPAEIMKAGGASIPMQRVGLTRKVLILLQFSLSIILVIGSIIVYDQLKFIQNQDLGFEKDQVLLLKLNRPIVNNFEAFENKLLQQAGVKSISTSSSVPGYRVMLEGAREISEEEDESTRLLYADETFLETFNIELEEGKNFDGNIKREENEFILNQEAVKMLFADRDPINQVLVVSGDTGVVVGIVKDFNFQTLHTSVEPLTIRNLPIALFGYASIKFEAKSTADVLAAIDVIGGEIYPDLPPLTTEFLDDRFEQLYMTESKLQSIVWIFCILTIILTISGIFSVASYNANKRAKEMAIRKVLGGDLTELMSQLSKGFLYILAFSLLIGIPGAYYLSKWWLQDFAYQVPINPVIFFISIVIMMLIVLFSSGFVTFKAATTNPTKALKEG